MSVLEPTSEERDGDRRTVRWAPLIALAALALGACLPPSGPGLPICWIKLWTGLPCLSCGLTRSFLRTLHGDWLGALHLHPLGPPVVLFCVFVAVLPILPAPLRTRCERRLAGYPLWAPHAACVLLAVLILNGLYRLWWSVGLGRPSPW